jgi:uncharacterized membrane protein YeaQ/YmgE (transglycosylase-associated protein family)
MAALPGDKKMFGILGWIAFGLLVGAMAKLLMPGRDAGGILITILIGMAGAGLGGMLGRFLGLYGPGQPEGFFMALIGSVSLLGFYRVFFVRRMA